TRPPHHPPTPLPITPRPPTPPLFPYTTLFRSLRAADPSGGRTRRQDHRPARGDAVGRPGAHAGAGSAPAEPGQGNRRLHHVHLRSEEHTSELQSRGHLVCRLLLEKKKKLTLNS